MTEPQTHDPATPRRRLLCVVPRPTVLRVVRDQRKVIAVGVVLMVACFWFIGQVGEWRTAALTAAGILLALLNHLASELWLGRLISSGERADPRPASPQPRSPGCSSCPSSPCGSPCSSGPTASACCSVWPSSG